MKNSKEKFSLKEGVDKKFFEMFYNFYRPFLSRSHLSDPFQYTICDNNMDIGFVQVGKMPLRFIQIAILPELRGKGIAIEVINKITEIVGSQKYGWTANRDNYPSLLLLSKLQGGIYEGWEKRKKYEGAFRVDGNISQKMKLFLSKALIVSKREFNDVVCGKKSIYKNR